jgi:hypothetical protein
LLAARGDSLGGDDAIATTGLDGLFDPSERVLCQQLQHANKVPSARQRPVAFFKTLAQLSKRRRQTPVAVDVSVIEIGWLHSQRRQVVQRVECLLALAVGALVLGNLHSVADDFDAIDVRFYRDGGEGVPPRHTVTVLLPGDRLILVDLADLAYSGFECSLGQRQCAGPLCREAYADRFALACDRPQQVAPATLEQIGIQLSQIIDPGDGRRPLTLQQLHSVLDMRLFITASWQAEQRLEVVMTGQRLPTLVQLSLSATEDRGRNRLRIVPPQFSGHATEKLKRRHRAVQDRLGLLARQRNREGGVRVRPRHEEDRNRAATFREVDPDLAEVALGPLAWLVRQREERFSLAAPLRGHVPPHLVIAANVLLFVSQPPEEMRRCMTLLARRLFVRSENRINPALMYFGEHPPRARQQERVRPRLRLRQHRADLPPRMSKRAGDLPNAHPIAMGTTYPAVILHLQHP